MEAVNKIKKQKLFFINHKRLNLERKTINTMVLIYCKNMHFNTKTQCNDCQELSNYALQRLMKCPFGENKPTCEKCEIHCYKLDMRKKIKTVMKYSGPHMAYKHPILTILHLIRNMNLNTKTSKSKYSKGNN